MALTHLNAFDIHEMAGVPFLVHINTYQVQWSGGRRVSRSLSRASSLGIMNEPRQTPDLVGISCDPGKNTIATTPGVERGDSSDRREVRAEGSIGIYPSAPRETVLPLECRGYTPDSCIRNVSGFADHVYEVRTRTTLGTGLSTKTQHASGCPPANPRLDGKVGLAVRLRPP